MQNQGKQAPQDWVEQHMKMAETLRVSYGSLTYKHASSAWHSTLTAREQDALPLLAAQVPNTMMRDLSQSIFRADASTWKSDIGMHVAPTMLPRMQLWLEPCGLHVKGARLMLGREALVFQGFPVLPFLTALEGYQCFLGPAHEAT